MVGYRRLEGPAAAGALARLYRPMRLEDLDQAEINRLSLNGDAEDRELLREGVRFLIELGAARAEHPEIADLLPRADIAPPSPVERAGQSGEPFMLR